MSVYIIAEAGVNHNGDLELAKSLVDMAKMCGADAVKFQTFKAEESTGKTALKAEYQQKNDSTLETQFEMIKKLELPFEDFTIIKKYCQEVGIDFISTPDGNASLKCLENLDVSLIKIGSTEVTNLPFLKEIAMTKKPLILSTGMSSLGEVENAINTIHEADNYNITLMHCTTDYPTDICDVNLLAMVTLRDAFHVPVGYSDHTTGFETAVSATTLGATCIEKHITLDREMKGPDHKASMPPTEFREYVEHIRNTEMLLGNGIKAPTLNEKEIMKQARRSILAARDLTEGEELTEDMLCFKRPGDGILPQYVDVLLGRKLKRNIKTDEKITWKDI